MGQYYMIANLDQRQYLNPNNFDCSLKLKDFNESLVMVGLSLLLAPSNNPGNGGDIKSTSLLCGSWASDRVVFVGDYLEYKHYGVTYDEVKDSYENISLNVLKALSTDADYSKQAEKIIKKYKLRKVQRCKKD